MFTRHDRALLEQIKATVIETRNRQELVFQRLGLVIEKEIAMAGELDALKAEVARNTDVDSSAVTLLNGLAAKIQELINAGGNPADFQALADNLKNSSDSLAAAVTANTPAA